MKIIQLIQKPQRRGAELFASQLAEELQQMGHEVLLISVFKGTESLPFSGRQIHLNRNPKNRLWDIAAWRKLYQIIQAEKPTVIQANAGDTLKFAVFSRWVFGWKVPIVFRNASLMSQYISDAWIRNLNQWLVNQVEGIASVSQASQQDMNRVFRLKRPVQQVIPIGIYPRKSDLQASDSTTINLVHIGGFTFEKNHSHLLDIFEELSQKEDRYRLTLIGDGPLWIISKEEVRKRNLEDKVTLLGSLKDPFSSIPSDAILLLPSKIEGLPAVILEAMLHRIPVVAYGVGGIPEVLKTGLTGWCISLEDKFGFIKAVEEVLSMDHATKDKILENGFQLVNEKYILEKVTRQFEEFYLSILHS